MSAKRDHRLELKTRKLQHVPAVRARAVHHGGDRHSDIPTHLHRHRRLAQDVADQAGGGGLAVGAGDPDGPALEKRRSQLHFADYQGAALAGLFEWRQVGGHIGREHNQVAPFEDLRRLRREGNVEPGQHRLRVVQLVQGLEIGGAHDRAMACQQFGCRHTGSLHPDHQRFDPAQLQAHLNFNVVRANSAITRPAIQKRAMIFDSAQPSASK